MKNKLVLLSLFTAIIFAGCLKEEIELKKDWDVYTRPFNIAMPVFKMHLSGEELLKNFNDSTTVSIDNDGLLYVKYKQPIKAEWFDVAKIDRLELNIDHDLMPGKKKGTKAEQVSFEERIKINLINEQVYDSIYLNDATLISIVNWPDGLTGNYTVTFPDIRQDGKPLVFISNPATDLEASERLPNFWIYPQHAPDSSYFRVQVTANIDQPTSIPSDTRLQVTIRFDELTPEIIFGKFGTLPVFDKDMSMLFTFFESYDLFEGIEFTGMYANLNIDNYTGTPYSVSMVDTRLTRRSTEEWIDITFNGNNSFLIDQPEYATPITPKNNLLVLDTSNSNIREAFNFFPDELNYHLTITSNPNGQLTENFLHRRNKVDGYLELNLPFWFRISGLWRNDTIQFDIAGIINDSTNSKYVEEMRLMFDFENGFPFELFTEGVLVNGDNEIIDSLFRDHTPIWLSGKLDASDRVTESTVNKVDLIFSGEQVRKYVDNKVTKIILHTEATSSNSGTRFVKLYNNYAVDIRFYFALRSNLSIN